MEKVISINLCGNAYQLEDKGYSLLNDYLMQARNSLASDPDKDEVMNDFEQAIAEKCDQLLQGHKKTVITSEEIQHIITAMGPVEADEADNTVHKESVPQSPNKRLFTLREGSMIGGVCTGLAAYFNMDVVIIRLIFIVLLFATSGFMAVIYLIMVLVVPEAKTPEEKAQLRGEQFNAQAVLERAKQKYADVSQSEHWEKVMQNSKPALSNFGMLIIRICKIVSLLMAIALAVIVAFGTIATFVLMWSLGTGSVTAPEQFSGVAILIMNIAVFCSYLFLIVPTVILMYPAFRFALGKPMGKQVQRLGIIGGVIWMISLAVGICIVVAHIDELRNYENSHNEHTIQIMEPQDI
jgi:phage shock protein PspC (stress-responsive transcriptional regulator)